MRANKKLERELLIAMNKIEQMKAEVPKKASKIQAGINYDQEDINKFFKKL